MLPSSASERFAYRLNRDVLGAIRDYQMIRPGERVLAAVSGGKDSLALLCLLDSIRKKTLHRFDLVAVHVRGDTRGPGAPPNERLYRWLADSGIDYHIRALHTNEDEPLPLNCHRCSRARRRTLFEAAQELGCPVIALGHHADDLAQSTLMNFLFNGRVEGMAPVREFFNYTIRIIRPLIYLREESIRQFARLASFPLPEEECMRSDSTLRKYAGDLLKKLEKDNPNVFGNLKRLGMGSEPPPPADGDSDRC
jgi:tRNA 2-thiocytidine biosynthesis protein TtcA